MSNMDVNQVLAQMRVMEAAAKGIGTSASAAGQATGHTAATSGGTSPAAKVAFSEVFQQTVDRVNEAQSTASNLSTAYIAGSKDVDLPEVMMAVQEASVSFQAISQVRNRLLSAYQDVMNMPL